MIGRRTGANVDGRTATSGLGATMTQLDLPRRLRDWRGHRWQGHQSLSSDRVRLDPQRPARVPQSGPTPACTSLNDGPGPGTVRPLWSTVLIASPQDQPDHDDPRNQEKPDPTGRRVPPTRNQPRSTTPGGPPDTATHRSSAPRPRGLSSSIEQLRPWGLAIPGRRPAGPLSPPTPLSPRSAPIETGQA
jgi:hypothetical protein